MCQTFWHLDNHPAFWVGPLIPGCCLHTPVPADMDYGRMATVWKRIPPVFVPDLFFPRNHIKHTRDPETTKTALKVSSTNSYGMEPFPPLSHLLSTSLTHLKLRLKYSEIGKQHDAYQLFSSVLAGERLPTHIVHFCTSCEKQQGLAVYSKI